MLDIVQQLGGPAAREDGLRGALIVDAGGDRRRVDAYRALRRREFVDLQGLFRGHDLDAADADPRTRVLVAVDPGGEVIGGVRLHPAPGAPEAEIGWWQGSRLVVAAGASRAGPGARGRIGAALVRAACARALDAGALRFDAHVQEAQIGFFTRLGWEPIRTVAVAGTPHALMRWPVDRCARLAAATKQPLGALVGRLLAGDRWRGDDAVPVPGSDVVACTDAITPSMVDRDPDWAGWCGMLVTAHDLACDGGVAGGWRSGYHGRQWDSTSWRTRAQLAPMLGVVAGA